MYTWVIFPNFCVTDASGIANFLLLLNYKSLKPLKQKGYLQSPRGGIGRHKGLKNLFKIAISIYFTYFFKDYKLVHDSYI